MGNEIIFSVRNLCKSYPGVQALDGVSLDFEQGKIHAIVGENGAGKSTLIKCLSGAVEPTSGTIIAGHNKYNALSPHLAKELGIAVIYQEFNQVPSMTASENIFLCEKTDGRVLLNKKERRRWAVELFSTLDVDVDPQSKVRDLSPAHQQIIEIAKVINKNVRLLIMDEPTAPLTSKEVEVLFRIIRELKQQGVSIIYISHRLEEIFSIADDVSVLRDGKHITTKPVRETNRKELISFIAGREISSVYPYKKRMIGPEVLRLEQVSGNGLANVSFSLHRSEILGFAGLVGAGRTELMQLIYGVAPIDSGLILKEGKSIRLRNPGAALRQRIGLIPEDRKKQGVFLEQNVRWNCSINSIRNFSRGMVINRKKERDNADYFRNLFKIKTPSLEQTVKNLSGGNQQKVVIAKTLSSKADILIFDEPTRGIDVNAKQEIYALLNQLADEGKALMVVSSDLPELLGMCDRIAVVCEGKLVQILERPVFNQNRILDIASGGSGEW